jgi:hypothetical protein
MPNENLVRNTYIDANTLEKGITNIFEIDYAGDEMDKTVIPDEFSLIGQSDEFLLYKVSANPIYSKFKSTLREMSNSSGSLLLVETDNKIMFDYLVKVVQWIEDLEQSVCESSITFVKKLVIPSSFGRRHADDGIQLFRELPDAAKSILSSYKITLSVGGQKKPNLSTIVSKGASSMHSLGVFVLRWFAFFINALKHDMGLLKKWEKDVTDIFKWRCEDPNNKRLLSLSFSLKGLKRLSDLATEAKENLIISPEDNILFNRIECTLREQGWRNEQRLHLEPLVHNLLMDLGAYCQSSGIVSAQKDEVAKRENEDLLCHESINPVLVPDRKVPSEFADLLCNESMSLM